MRNLTWKWHWPSPDGLPSLSLIASLLVILLALGSTAILVEADLVRLVKSTGKLLEFAGHLLVLPEWSYFPTLFTKMVETIEIAFLSTTFSLFLSLPLGILAAQNSSPLPIVSHISRNLLSLMRALPEVVWALVFVSAVGLGSLPGIMALTFVTTGFMAKFFAESIEVVDRKAIEGVTATGASWLQLITFAMLPQASLSLLQMEDGVFHEPYYLGEIPVASAWIELTNSVDESFEGAAQVMSDSAELAVALAVCDVVMAHQLPGWEKVEVLIEKGLEKRALEELKQGAMLAKNKVDFSLLSQEINDAED